MANRVAQSLLATKCYLLFLSMLPALTYTTGEVYVVTLEGTTTWEKLGTLANPSEADRAYSLELEAQHDELLESAFTSADYKKLYSYTHLINGFAIQTSNEQADTLRSLEGVRWVEKDWKVEKMTTHTPEFLGLPYGLWPEDGGPGSAGEGVIIGIIDTGIDPTHPSFSSSGHVPYAPLQRFYGYCEETPSSGGPFCNGKIVAARHFSAAAEAAGVFNSSTDFASPLDGDGHGSHTASIAAGNHGVSVLNDGLYFGEASGMAPRARLAIYKALYRQFGGFVSDVVKAIDQAAKDGVDVLSLSVGPSSPPSSTRSTFLNAFDVALLSAVKAGIFVVQAAGNGGPYPRTMASFSPWIMSVAAGLDDRNYSNWISLGNGAKLMGAGLAPATPDDQLYDLILAEDALANTTGGFSYNPTTCQQPEAFNKSLVQSKILLCTYSFSFIYGGSTVRRVADTAHNLSAIGFVLFTKSEMPGTKLTPVPMAVSGIVITDVQNAFTLLSYYNESVVRDSSGQVTTFGAQAKIGNGLSPGYQGVAPQVALFSSRGPCVRDYSMKDADILKPNILAPGSLIWAAWTPIGIDEPNFIGQAFAMMSGTSMATPHVAGIAALLKQKHPDWSPAAIASAMMTTASVVDNKGSPLLAQLFSTNGAVSVRPATPLDMGSGAINATAAVDPGLIFDAGYQDYINFLCSSAGADHVQVTNVTGSTCNEKIGLPADLNLPSITIASLSNPRTVTRTVKSVSGGRETYTASCEAPTGVAMDVSPQSFTIEAGGSAAFSVTLRVSATLEAEYSFGALLLKGDQGHRVRVPVAVRAS